MEPNLPERKRRQIDTTNADARRAIRETLQRFGPWRMDLARFAVLVDRRATKQEREEILTRCHEILADTQAARVALLESLMNAPRRLLANSRIADVERALDDVDATVARLRQQLGH